MNNYKTIGIIGGMGPLATYDLAEKILKNTVADCDQDNVPVLIDCNTRIADRTAAILHGGDDPLPEMKKSAERLEAAGADVLIPSYAAADCSAPAQYGCEEGGCTGDRRHMSERRLW